MRSLLIQIGFIALVIWLLVKWSEIVAWLRGVAVAGRENRNAGSAAPRMAPEEQKRQQRFEAYAEEVGALSIEAAKLRAESILADECFWRCTPSEADESDRIRALSESLRDHFTRFAVIEEAYGGSRLSREEIEPYRWHGNEMLTFGTESPPGRARYLRIGSDIDNSPIVVRAGEEMVYIMHKPTITGATEWSVRYPSVYHWILMRYFYQQESQNP